MLLVLLVIISLSNSLKTIDWSHCDAERRNILSKDERTTYKLQNMIQAQDGPAITGEYYHMVINSKLLVGTLDHLSLIATIEQSGKRYGVPFKKNLCSLFTCPVKEGEEREFSIDYPIPRAPARFLNDPFFVTVEIKNGFTLVDCIKFNVKVEVE